MTQEESDEGEEEEGTGQDVFGTPKFTGSQVCMYQKLKLAGHRKKAFMVSYTKVPIMILASEFRIRFIGVCCSLLSSEMLYYCCCYLFTLLLLLRFA